MVSHIFMMTKEKRDVFGQVLKISIEGEDQIVRGQPFHNLGTKSENTVSPLDFNLVSGMERSNWSPGHEALNLISK